MKILVTGATGFIGSHLIRTLVEMGHECLGMDNLSLMGYPEWVDEFTEDNSNVRFCVGQDGDCTTKWNVFNACKKFNPELIFNLAVLPLPHSLVDPITNYSQNVEMTKNVVLEAAAGKRRLIHFSSSEVYGTAEEDIMNESHVLRPTTPYAAAKASCDHLVQSMVNTFGIDATIVRPFNTYGPGQNEDTYAAVIPKMIKTLTKGEMITITGDGTQTRDFNYVTDIVDAAILAAEIGKPGEVYNICSGKETSINDIATMIAESLGLEEFSVDYVDARKGDVKRHRGDNTKAMTEIGWKPVVNVKDGLKETVKWYMERV